VIDGDPLAEPEQLLDEERIWLVIQGGQPVAGGALEAKPGAARARRAAADAARVAEAFRSLFAPGLGRWRRVGLAYEAGEGGVARRRRLAGRDRRSFGRDSGKARSVLD
jgi:hypothetical protein